MEIDRSYWQNKGLIPINVEERQKLIDYEIWMFRNTCKKIVCLKSDLDQTDKNLLVESLAIHSRLLIDFFYNDFFLSENKKKISDRNNLNDIIAVDFVSDWIEIRPELTQALYDAREKANKQLAHLSQWRIKIENDGRKPWDTIDIWGNMEKVIKKFMENKKILAKFWEDNKHESNLTLSVKLNEQNYGEDELIKRIRSIQDIAKNNLSNVLFFSDPYELENEGGLFIYPEDRFHFSLVNFLKCSCDFDIFSNNRDNNQYTGVKKEIISIIKEKLNNLKLDISFKIKSIYKNNKIDSISLQAYTDNKDFLDIIKEIKREAEKKLDKDKIKTLLGCEKDVKIKLRDIENSKEYYAVINILRFMRSDNNIKMLEEINLDNLVNKIENDINKNGTYFSFGVDKLCLIESDPFLFKWNKVEDF